MRLVAVSSLEEFRYVVSQVATVAIVYSLALFGVAFFGPRVHALPPALEYFSDSVPFVLLILAIISKVATRRSHPNSWAAVRTVEVAFHIALSLMVLGAAGKAWLDGVEGLALLVFSMVPLAAVTWFIRKNIAKAKSMASRTGGWRNDTPAIPTRT